MENIANNLLSFRHLNDKGFCESHRNFPQGCLGFGSGVLLRHALRNHKRKTIAKQKHFSKREPISSANFMLSSNLTQCIHLYFISATE